ncbi:MAG: hypothetical protein ACUVQ0_06085 [Thermoproteota archaeon]
MRRARNTQLIVSGLIAIIPLLAASGIIISILAGAPGTWKSNTGEDKLAGGAMSIRVYAAGKYNSAGTGFDWASNSASRSLPTGPSLIIPIKLKIEVTRNGDVFIRVWNDAVTGGVAFGAPGSFWYVGTKGWSTYALPGSWAPMMVELYAAASVGP